MPMTCPSCQGKGAHPPTVGACPKCNGRGYTSRTEYSGFEQNVTGQEIRTPDNFCGGTGKVSIPGRGPCLQCAGTGQVKLVAVPRQCSQCAGSGQVGGPERYPSGMSKRQTTCPGCNGTKTMWAQEYVPDLD